MRSNPRTWAAERRHAVDALFGFAAAILILAAVAAGCALAAMLP